MKIEKLGAVVAAAFIVLAMAPASASAAALTTEALLANLKANTAFLDKSSRLAVEHSEVATTRTFAKEETDEQTKAIAALSNAETQRRLAVAAVSAFQPEPVETGRSVAVVGDPAAEAARNVAANGRVALGQTQLDELKGLSGKKFDDAYWKYQLDALSQIESDYHAAVSSGDDLALAVLSKAELPKVVSRLEALSKI